MKTTRRLFVNFLFFAPVLNFVNAVRKWFAPPPDVVTIPGNGIWGEQSRSAADAMKKYDSINADEKARIVELWMNRIAEMEGDMRRYVVTPKDDA